MRNLFISLILFSISACNSQKSNTNINLLNQKELKASDNTDIFGNWSMCSTSGDSETIQMNVCLEIIFKSNGTGLVGNNLDAINPLISENFIWTLEKKHLKILNINKKEESTFIDTNYYADFNKQKDRIELIMTHNKQSYYLVKSISTTK